MKYCCSLQIQAEIDSSLFGGKGASLVRLKRAGFRVPRGFVVLTNAFEAHLKRVCDFLTISRQKLETLNGIQNSNLLEKLCSTITDMEIQEDIANEILKQFNSLELKLVAVRSSAMSEDSIEASWAGQLKSFLNCSREEVLQKIKECWASIFQPQAISYKEFNYPQNFSSAVGVVIQAMVKSDSAGIIFTIDPETNDGDEVVINAAKGLGEAVVSGQINPDVYVVEKHSGNIINRRFTSDSPALTDKQICELSRLALNIETEWGHPCDIEWALENDVLYFTQCRPITTYGNTIVGDKRTHGIASRRWFIDWEGYFLSVFVFIPHQAFGNFFGVQYPRFILLYKNGYSQGLYDYDDYEIYGRELAKLLEDREKTKQWCKTSRLVADRTYELLNNDAFFLLQHFEEVCKLHVKYAVLQQMMKLAYNFLSKHEFRPDISSQLEAARKYSEDFYKISTHALDKLSHFVSNKNPRYSQVLVNAMNDKEMIKYSKGGDLPDIETLRERHEWSATYFCFQEADPISLDKEVACSIEKSWLMEQNTAGLLRGDGVYSGKVKGYCRLVKHFHNLVLEENEILVIGMTDPQFSPLIASALAIITDGGGRLCHAAIIAREMKKPGVIGTNVATQVLNTGDYVEVDADAGLVTILRRCD